MKRILLFVLACNIFKGLNAQKVLSMAKIDNADFRIVKLKLKKEDKYQCQKLVNKKWTILFTKDIPSEGMRFFDANNDGFMDIVLQYRFAQEVHIFSTVKNKFHNGVIIGYDGFTIFEKGKNLFYSLFTTKYDYGYQAGLYYIDENKITLIASAIEVAKNPATNADSLVYTLPTVSNKPQKIVLGQDAINEFANEYVKERSDLHFTWHLFLKDFDLMKWK